MKKKIDAILNDVVKCYDEGVVWMSSHELPVVWLLSIEDAETALGVLDEIASRMSTVMEELTEDTIDIQCIFKKRITYIIIRYLQ